MPRALIVQLLGSLEVRCGDQPVAIGGAKPRAVLCLLGLYAGRVVSNETLIEVLWGEDAPRTAQKALQTHVSALRRDLGEGFVLTKGAGWLLNGATTDVQRFDEATATGRAAARAGDPAAAVTAFDLALDSWRGPPELPHTPRAASEVARWVEQHETVTEDRFEALLAAGAAAELVGELESAVAAAPLRERRWSQLMLALYRAGRQADALAAYRRARAMLDEQLGVAPGPELRKLEAAILGQDPGIAAPQRAAAPRRPRAHTQAEHVRGLPPQRTTFVGRQEELGRLDAALRSHPLVTVVGPGGVGKTRLAIAAAQSAAHQFHAGVVFVDLVPVTSAFVVQAVAAALGIAERPRQPLAEAVRERLAQDDWLLVIDNCEHVLDAVSQFVAGLSAACPNVVVLATSRERLGTSDERVITVPPLAVISPETGQAKGSEAVTLFLDRARAIEPHLDPDPAPVGEVCARLDGVPLAIELAAARCASLGIDGVLTALDDRMRLLTGARGTANRHRSLRAVIDWSHDLLDVEERAVFRWVAVFAGGFDLDAAAAVACGGDGKGLSRAAVADLVGRLADKNLLTHRRGKASRWRLLEIVRVYAAELLAASGEEAAVRARHLRWAADTAERIEQLLVAGEAWRDDFDAVVDDLRSALDGADADDEAEHVVVHRLARALGHLAYARSYLAEAQRHYQAAAAHAAGRTAVGALRSAVSVAFAQMRSDAAFELLLDAAERSAAANDQTAEAISLASAVVFGARFPGSFPEASSRELLGELLARARRAADESPLVAAHIAAAEAWTASPVRARCDGPLGERALAAAMRIDDPVLISAALDGVTTAALGHGRFRRAAMLAGKRLELLDRFTRHDPAAGGEIGDIFHMATETAIASGNLPAALAAAARAGDDSIGQGVPMLAPSRLTLTHALSGAFADAREEATEMARAWERAGRPSAGWMAPALYAAALVCGLTGDQSGVRAWSTRALELTKDQNVQGFAPFVHCRVALHDGRLAEALGIAERLPGEYLGKFDAYARAIAAECAVVAGLPDAEAGLAAVESAGEENDWAAACLVRARGRLDGDEGLLARSVAGWEHIDARFERACTLLLIADRAREGRAELAALGCPMPATPDNHRENLGLV